MYYVQLIDEDFYQTCKYYDDREEALKHCRLLQHECCFIRGYVFECLTGLILYSFDKVIMNDKE